MPITDKAVFLIVRSYGLTIGKREGEYRINFKGGREETAFYTHDREDAVCTARYMFKEGNRNV